MEEGKEFLVVTSGVNKEVINLTSMYLLWMFSYQLLRVLHNIFVFTNNLWPREVWREWGHHQPENSSANSGGNFFQPVPEGWLLPARKH